MKKSDLILGFLTKIFLVILITFILDTANKITNITPPYVHFGLTNGIRYYYVVTAVHSTGETFGPYAYGALCCNSY
jgi:hypothetical protein